MADSSAETRTYTTPELAAITGRTVNKTMAYITRDLIRPSIQDADGSGTRRIWSYLDVVRVCLVKHFEDLGVTVPVMRVLHQYMLSDESVGRNSRWAFRTHETTPEDAEADTTIEAWHASKRGIPFWHGKISPTRLLFVWRSEGAWPWQIGDDPLTIDNDAPTIVVSLAYVHKWARRRIAQLEA